MTASELIRCFYETVVSENDVSRVPDFVSDRLCLRLGEHKTAVGVEGMIGHIAATKSTYPDYTVRITRQFCDGDYVISEFVMEGSHEGEWFGIEPSHRRLTFTGVNIDRVEEGKITEHGGAVNTFETLWEQGLIVPEK